MNQNQHIHCLVENCHYWGQGNVCQANEIIWSPLMNLGQASPMR